MAKISQMLTETGRPALVLGFIGMLLTGLLLSSCNTAEGVGEDVSAAGNAVSDTADDLKD